MENKKGIFFPSVLLSMLLLSFGVNSLKGVKDELERTSSPFTPVEKAGDAVEQVVAVSFLKAPFTYTLETIKSDLSIGDNIVEHTTFSSKFAAAVRMAIYTKVMKKTLNLLFFGFSRSDIDLKLLDKFALEQLIQVLEEHALVRPQWFFEGAVLDPIFEEFNYTFLPQLLIRKITDNLVVRDIFSCCAAIRFGLVHKRYDFRMQLGCAMSGYFNHRYLLKRSLKDGLNTCIMKHMFYNSYCFIVNWQRASKKLPEIYDAYNAAILNELDSSIFLK